MGSFLAPQGGLDMEKDLYPSPVSKGCEMPTARAVQSCQQEPSSEYDADRTNGRSAQSCMFAGLEQKLKGCHAT